MSFFAFKTCFILINLIISGTVSVSFLRTNFDLLPSAAQEPFLSQVGSVFGPSTPGMSLCSLLTILIDSPTLWALKSAVRGNFMPTAFSIRGETGESCILAEKHPGP